MIGAQVLEPPPAQARFSDTPTEACPISMVTGEELLPLEEFTLPGPIAFAWRRFYRSGQDRDIGLGHGWAHSGCERLKLSGSHVVLRDAEGREIYFPRPALGQHSRQPADGLDLDYAAADCFILRRQGEPDRVFKRHSAGNTYLLSEIRHDVYVPGGINRQGKRAEARGFILRFHHNPAGRVIRIIGNWGKGLGIERDDQGRISAVYQLDAEKQRLHPARTQYHYDADNDLVAQTNAAGATERYAYQNHVLVQRTLSTGFAYHYEWDQHTPEARCRRICGEGGEHDTHFEWEVPTHSSRATNSLGQTRHYQYNDLGRATQITDGEGRRWRYTYADGQRVAAIDPQGRETRYLYDKACRLTGYQDALKQNAAISYFKERLSSFTDVDGAFWQRDYDNFGQLTCLSDPQGGQLRYEYDKHGLPIRIVDAAGRSTRLKWNAQAELIEKIDAFGNLRNYVYDEWGRITSLSVSAKDAETLTTGYRYTPLGQIATVIGADGARTDYQYDEHARLLRQSDSQGRIIEYAYDGLNRVVTRTDPQGYRLHYEYDTEGNLRALTNENGECHRFRYDASARLIEEIGFDGRVQGYRYNEAGELIEHIDAQLARTLYERDALGRVISKTCQRARDPEHADMQIDKLRYDAKGRITEVYNADQYLALSYDKRGALLQERAHPRNSKGQLIKGADNTLEHKYNTAGQRVQTRLNDGRVLHYDYHLSGGLRELRLDDRLIVSMVRDGFGRAKLIRQGELQTQYDYDSAGRVLRAQVRHGETEAQLWREYHYDVNARISQIRHEHGEMHFSYDRLDRLLRVESEGQGARERFDFDPAGNPLDARRPPMSGFVKGNQLTLFEDARYEYDARGNLVQERAQGRTRRFVYDYQNRLIQVLDGDQGASYRYDSFSRRIEKRGAQGKIRYLWSGDTLLQEISAQSDTLYFFEPGSHRVLAMLRDGALYYYHLDHRGAVLALTDEAGEPVWQAPISAWGASLEPTLQTLENNLRLPGQYYDPESQLHYSRERYYNPATGSYINQNPIGLLAGLNPYAYAPNPVMYSNPLGIAHHSEQQQDLGLIAKQIEGSFAAHRYFSLQGVCAQDTTHHGFAERISEDPVHANGHHDAYVGDDTAQRLQRILPAGLLDNLKRTR